MRWVRDLVQTITTLSNIYSQAFNRLLFRQAEEVHQRHRSPWRMAMWLDRLPTVHRHYNGIITGLFMLARSSADWLHGCSHMAICIAQPWSHGHMYSTIHWYAGVDAVNAATNAGLWVQLVLGIAQLGILAWRTKWPIASHWQMPRICGKT